MVIYEPLKPDCIRLLSFLDESGQRCSLDEHSLTDPPEYWTLSYTWNDDGPSTNEDDKNVYQINVNGQPFKIQKNLAAAFTCLAPRAFQLKRYVWADYICINQADEVEKSSQVQMMKDIYAKAKVVRAWLGRPRNDENVRLAVEMITSIGQSWRRAPVVYPGEIDLEVRERRPGFPTDEPKSVAGWEGIKEIFGRSFWERTWCHLECSKNDIRFFCGELTFDSFDFQIMGTAMHVYQRMPGFDQRLRMVTASRLFNARNNRDEDESLYLLSLLSEIRPTLCADPRDKVFAVLPHAIDLPKEGSLSVDYSKNLLEVYTDVLRFSLEHGNGLGILGYVSTFKDEESEVQYPVIPSWIPDWRATNVYVGLGDGKDDTNYDPLPGATVNATISGTELHLRGYEIDTLAALTDAGYQHNDIFEVAPNWVQQLANMGMQFPDSVLNRTLTGNALMGLIDDKGEQVYKRWDEVDWASIMNPQTTADGWNRDHIRGVLNHFCMSRRLGYTTEAVRLGLFPLNAQVGDSIVAIEGGKTLYLVRKVGEESERRFEFLSECYVNGFMDGVLMEMIKEQESPSEPIVLN